MIFNGAFQIEYQLIVSVKFGGNFGQVKMKNIWTWKMWKLTKPIKLCREGDNKKIIL